MQSIIENYDLHFPQIVSHALVNVSSQSSEHSDILSAYGLSDSDVCVVHSLSNHAVTDLIVKNLRKSHERNAYILKGILNEAGVQEISGSFHYLTGTRHLDTITEGDLSPNALRSSNVYVSSNEPENHVMASTTPKRGHNNIHKKQEVPQSQCRKMFHNLFK